MATYESDTLIQTQDKEGNTVKHYPQTKGGNVALSAETKAALNITKEGATVEDALLAVNMADKIGETTDSGGSETTGTVFGKLNFIISYLKGYVTDGLVNIGNYVKRLNDLFTDARVQKIDTIDTNVSKVVSEVAKIVPAVTASMKHPVTKIAAVQAPYGTTTILNLTGAGSLDVVYSVSAYGDIRVTIDGVATYTSTIASGAYCTFGSSIADGKALGQYTAAKNITFPLHFSKSLKLEVINSSNGALGNVYAGYTIYE